MLKFNHIAGSSNGRIRGSEPRHLGSSPSPAATLAFLITNLLSGKHAGFLKFILNLDACNPGCYIDALP